MKKLIVLPMLLALCGCSIDWAQYKAYAPNHVGLRPGYEMDVSSHNPTIHKYKMEGQVDWNW